MMKTIKWIALNAVIINEVNSAIKIAIIFVFVDEIYFPLAYLHCKCNLNNLE